MGQHHSDSVLVAARQFHLNDLLFARKRPPAKLGDFVEGQHQSKLNTCWSTQPNFRCVNVRDFISRTVCSVVAQYDNDDGDGNMINCDMDDMIMVVLKKIMRAFKSITKDDEYKFEAVCEKLAR